MGFFDKAKDVYKLRKQAKDMKKKLKNIHIEAEHKGVKIVINAEMEVIDVNISPELTDNKLISSYVKESFTKAIKKAQLVAAENMKDIMGDFGFPGM